MKIRSRGVVQQPGQCPRRRHRGRRMGRAYHLGDDEPVLIGEFHPRGERRLLRLPSWCRCPSGPRPSGRSACRCTAPSRSPARPTPSPQPPPAPRSRPSGAAVRTRPERRRLAPEGQAARHVRRAPRPTAARRSPAAAAHLVAAETVGGPIPAVPQRSARSGARLRGQLSRSSRHWRHPTIWSHQPVPSKCEKEQIPLKRNVQCRQPHCAATARSSVDYCRVHESHNGGTPAAARRSRECRPALTSPSQPRKRPSPAPIADTRLHANPAYRSTRPTPPPSRAPVMAPHQREYRLHQSLPFTIAAMVTSPCLGHEEIETRHKGDALTVCYRIACSAGLDKQTCAGSSCLYV